MIKLYLDENVPEAIAAELRLRGYDVTTVKDARRKGISDIEKLKYAASEDRVLFTFNIADFFTLFILNISGRKSIMKVSYFPGNFL